MLWNWQLPNWPHFTYNPEAIEDLEKKFLVKTGSAHAFLKSVDDQERKQFIVEIMSVEGVESSKIEGEYLERESLQSSIRKHFGLQAAERKKNDRESGMADLLYSVFETYDKPLTHDMLYNWHAMLFKNSSHLESLGAYRTHEDPMQIVSGRLDRRRVFFEAPPSHHVTHEMNQLITWYNSVKMPTLAKACILHVYFESIHPFEDGNGRIGRALVEKSLSCDVGHPIVLAISQCLEKNKKTYYQELERCNRTLDVQSWVAFFADIILQAQNDSIELLQFLLTKAKMLHTLAGKLNPRQEKVLLRMFQEGPKGFEGGLNADKYMAITGAPRATTTRDLNDLVEKGALKKIGELRHTRYHLLVPT